MGTGFLLFGQGVYAVGANSPALATVFGASSTEAVVRFSTAGLNIVSTYWPYVYRVTSAVPVENLIGK